MIHLLAVKWPLNGYKTGLIKIFPHPLFESRISMKPLEMTIAISPVDLAPWKGADVPVRFIITKRSVEVCFPQPPNLTPDVLTPEVLRQLRTDFSEIKLSLSLQSRELLWFLLNTANGKATREELIEGVWPKKIPTWGDVRKAVHSLNTALKQLNFGWIVRGERKGVYHLVPFSR